MTPQERVDFRKLLLQYVERIGDQDAEGQLKMIDVMELWISDRIELAVSKAVMPFVKISGK